MNKTITSPCDKVIVDSRAANKQADGGCPDWSGSESG